MSVGSVMLSNHPCYVALFCFCLQSFPASGSFPVSQFFASGGQSIRVSASAWVLPMNIQGWFPLGLTCLIFFSPRDLKSLLQHHNWKASILQRSAFFMVQILHLYMTTGKTIPLTRQIFVGKVMSLLFNTMSRFVIVFLPRSKHLLISWLRSLSAVTLGSNKIKYNKMKFVTVSTFPPFYLPWSDGTGCHDFSFWMLSFKPAFSLSFFTFIKKAR